MFFTRKPSITPEQAAAGVATRELVLVDVRQPAELRAGYVRGAVNIPLIQLRPGCTSSSLAVNSRSCATQAPAARARPRVIHPSD